MKGPALKSLLLCAAITAAGPGQALGETHLPNFSLDSIKIRSMPRCREDNIPEVPPPTDTGYYSRRDWSAARLDSLVKVVVEGESGRADITFPEAKEAGYRSALFVKFAMGKDFPELSWAAVLCSGGRYMGYKGSSLEFPRGGYGFRIHDEALALGPLKSRLGRTHPWLLQAAPSRDPDLLCSDAYRKEIRPYSVGRLPSEAGGFLFKYDTGNNSLTVTWKK